MSVEQFVHERRYSRIESEFPDEKEFPLFYKARKTVVEIGPGDMLFIPAEMFHFVISEKGDDEFNFAVNFWYEDLVTDKNHKLGKHEIKDISFIHDDENIEVYKTKTNLFPPKHLLSRYPDLIEFEYMKFSEFMATKNPKYYMLQNKKLNFDHLIKYAPPDHPNKVHSMTSWCNFGQGTTSLIHYDLHDNWLCQVKGKKRIILFPNEDRHLLYMWNPLDLNLINNIDRRNYYLEFFMIEKDAISDELCSTIASGPRYFKNEFLSKLLQKALLKYEERLNSMSCSSPICTFPYKFELVSTENIDYPKVDTKQNFPYVILWVLSGKGTLVINKNFHFNLVPRDFILFPHSFMYNWFTMGDLKMVTIVS